MKYKQQERFNPYGAILSEAKYTSIMFSGLLIFFEGSIAYADWINQGKNANYPVFYIIAFAAAILVIIAEAFPLSVFRAIMICADKLAGNETLSDCAIQVGFAKTSFNKSHSPAYKSYKSIQTNSVLSIKAADSDGHDYSLIIDSSFFTALDGYEEEALVFSKLVFGRASKVVRSFELKHSG